MNWEIQEELDRLKERLESGSMYIDKANNFFEVYDYEDEYSHNEIDEFQSEFMEKAKIYLKEKYSGLFAITFGAFCVHIITVEWMKQRKLKGWTIC